MPNYIGSMGTLPPSIQELRLQEDARQFDNSQGFGNISALLSLLMRKREIDADNSYRDMAFKEDLAARKRAEAAERVARMDELNAANVARADQQHARGMALHQSMMNDPMKMAERYAEASRRESVPIAGGGGFVNRLPRDPGLQRALSAMLGIEGNRTSMGSDLRAEGDYRKRLFNMQQQAAPQQFAPQMDQRGTPNYVYLQQQPQQQIAQQPQEQSPAQPNGQQSSLYDFISQIMGMVR